MSISPNKEIHKDMFDSILDLIWNDVSDHYDNKIQYILKFDSTSLRRARFFSDGNLSDSFRIELIENIKTKYPGCTITYNETTCREGKIVEQMFIIDW